VSATRDIAEKVEKQERRIVLITGGTIEFWSLDTADPGRSRKYARVIIDEAGIVRDLEAAWNEAIRPTLTDYRGDAWFLGTPRGAISSIGYSSGARTDRRLEVVAVRHDR